MEDIDIALKHALGIRWAFMGPFEIKLDKEQRQRLAYQDRPDRIKKRNQMIALIRKLKLELGEDV